MAMHRKYCSNNHAERGGCLIGLSREREMSALVSFSDLLTHSGPDTIMVGFFLLWQSLLAVARVHCASRTHKERVKNEGHDQTRYRQFPCGDNREYFVITYDNMYHNAMLSATQLFRAMAIVLSTTTGVKTPCISFLRALLSHPLLVEFNRHTSEPW